MINGAAESAAIIRALDGVPLFRDLAPELLAMVAAEATTQRAPAGSVLFRMGDDGEEMFVILRGVVRIVLPGVSGEEVVAELGSGRWFGEMTLITGEPRSAAARVMVDTDLLLLTRASFHALLARMPVLGVRLSEELSRRLRSRLVASAPHDTHRLIVLDDPDGSPQRGVVAHEITRALADELAAPVAYVDLGAGALTSAAGRVQPHACSDLAGVERLRRSSATLVMRIPRDHALSAQVRGLPGVIVDAAALMSSPVERSPVQVGILTSPLQQLVRRLLRRRVGLVLGAGGAKGLAHVGAIRSFERAGLRVDMLAGTSMGAIVATLVALGWSSERLHELAERVRRNFRRLLIDIHLSGSLLRGAKKRTLLAELTDGKTFEDLGVPLWIVTADLALQREFVFDSGDLAIALDATSAIPTIFPVVPFEERQLVDGWVVNPLPADVLRRKGADIVIGVDPNLADDRASRPHRTHRPRRWWRRFLDPRTLIDPVGMVRVAMQAMDVGARERTTANLALTDICVQPALGAYATTDVQKLPAILEAGEAAAEAALPGIHAALHLGAPTG